MSQGATKREVRRRERKELLDKLRIVRPLPGDVFVIEVREDYFDDDGRMETAQIFANDLHAATGRNVYIVKEGYTLVAMPDPNPPKPEIVTPPSGIMLPSGVKLGGHPPGV